MELLVTDTDEMGPWSGLNTAEAAQGRGGVSVQLEYFSDCWEGQDIGPELRGLKIKPGTFPALNIEPIRDLRLALARAKRKGVGK